MRVVLHDAVFGAAAVSSMALIAIFERGWEGCHRVFLLDDDGPRYRAWIAARDSEVREAIDFALARGLEEDQHAPAQDVTIEVDLVSDLARSPHPVLSVDRARDVMTKPLRVLVEDNPNDSNFIRSVARGDVRVALDRALERKHLEFVHGGGSNLPKQIPEDFPSCLRSCVMFDSDANAAGREGEQSRRIRQKCEEVEDTYGWPRGSYYHRLQRRMIENYIPPSCLTAWATERHRRTQGRQSESAKAVRRARAFERLPEDLRWYYHLKKGLETDQNDPSSAFAGFGDNDARRSARDALWNGFGDGLAAEFYTDRGFRGRAPNLDDDHRLQADDRDGELDGMVRRLPARM